MALTVMTITKTLESEVEFSAEAVEEILRDAAVEAMNADLAEQGLPHRITREEVTVSMYCSSQGDFEGASVRVKKEVE